MARPPSPEDAAAFERARRLFQSLGDVRIRRMFGGAGVYVDGVMMALIADGVLYLKVDETTVGLFREAGCRPFEWVLPSRGVPVRMSYWTLPATRSPSQGLDVIMPVSVMP
jgi:DNA transformation protein